MLPPVAPSPPAYLRRARFPLAARRAGTSARLCRPRRRHRSRLRRPFDARARVDDPSAGQPCQLRGPLFSRGTARKLCRRATDPAAALHVGSGLAFPASLLDRKQLDGRTPASRRRPGARWACHRSGACRDPQGPKSGLVADDSSAETPSVQPGITGRAGGNVAGPSRDSENRATPPSPRGPGAVETSCRPVSTGVVDPRTCARLWRSLPFPLREGRGSQSPTRSLGALGGAATSVGTSGAGGALLKSSSSTSNPAAAGAPGRAGVSAVGAAAGTP